MQKLRMLFLSSALVVNSSLGMELSLLAKKEMRSNDSLVHQLVNAIEYDTFDTCKTIIEKYPDVVNCKYYAPQEGDLCTPLHSAVDRDNIPAARLLLTHKALINAKTECWQYTPLHMVRSKEMAKLLLVHGADVNSRDQRAETPLCHVFFGHVQWNDQQRYGLAHYLLKKGADISESVDYKGNTLLHRAVKNWDSSAIRFLLEHNATINRRNIEGKTPLEVLLSSSTDCGWLLKKFAIDGAIVSALPYEDPFQLLKDNAKLFKYWISSGYSDSKRKVENFLACLFMKAQHNNNYPQGDKTVLYKEWVGDKEISFFDLEQSVGKEAIDFVKKHLSSKCHQALSAAGNSDYKELRSIVRYYPFVLAYDKEVAFELLQCVMSRDKEIFKYLLSNKPDLSVVDSDGNTLLHRAIESKDVHAIVLLMQKNINLTRRNQSQQTAIDMLYNGGDQDCIEAFYSAFAEKFFATYSYRAYYQEIKKLLKEPKFDINFKHKDGKSLLQRAAESYPEKCSVLLKNGALLESVHLKYADVCKKKYDEQRFSKK